MQIPGVGIVGVQTVFEDYRDVEGMQIAFRIRSTYQSRLIGRIIVEFDRARLDWQTTPHDSDRSRCISSIMR